MRSEPDDWELDEEAEEPMVASPRPQRRLPSRRSRRNRTHKTTFGFGHFMLPIVGLVAVGMLVLGIRLFFFPSHDGESPPQVVEEVNGTTMTGVQPSKADGGEGEVVAVPEGSVPEVVVPAPKTKDTQAKQEAKPPVTKPQTPTPVAAGIAPTAPKTAVAPAKPAVETIAKEAWNVQVGAFKDRGNAENLVKKLKQEGFSARLVEMKSGEVSLSKVLVQAGEDRASADRLAKTLSEKGYPVLVVRLP